MYCSGEKKKKVVVVLFGNLVVRYSVLVLGRLGYVVHKLLFMI